MIISLNPSETPIYTENTLKMVKKQHHFSDLIQENICHNMEVFDDQNVTISMDPRSFFRQFISDKR